MRCKDCGSDAWTCTRSRTIKQFSPVILDQSGKTQFQWSSLGETLGKVKVECAKCGGSEVEEGAWFVSKNGKVIVAVTGKTGVNQFFDQSAKEVIKAEMNRLDILHNHGGKPPKK